MAKCINCISFLNEPVLQISCFVSLATFITLQNEIKAMNQIFLGDFRCFSLSAPAILLQRNESHVIEIFNRFRFNRKTSAMENTLSRRRIMEEGGEKRERRKKMRCKIFSVMIDWCHLKRRKEKNLEKKRNHNERKRRIRNRKQIVCSMLYLEGEEQGKRKENTFVVCILGK